MNSQFWQTLHIIYTQMYVFLSINESSTSNFIFTFTCIFSIKQSHCRLIRHKTCWQCCKMCNYIILRYNVLTFHWRDLCYIVFVMKTEACNTELRECRGRKRERETWWRSYKELGGICIGIVWACVNTFWSHL